MKWIKYNHKYAEGPSQEIEYLELPEKETEETIKELIKALKDENYWNHGYRGLDYEVVYNLPVEFLDKYIEVSKEYIEYHTNRITKLEKKKEELQANISTKEVEEFVLDLIGNGSYSTPGILECAEYEGINPKLAKDCIDKLYKDGTIYMNEKWILNLI